MRNPKPFVPLLLLSLFSMPAIAGEAHVCRSAAVAQSSKSADLSDSTSFTCGGNVSGTVPSLAQAGWNITHVQQQADILALATLKPGQIPQNPEELRKTYWTLVIQR